MSKLFKNKEIKECEWRQNEPLTRKYNALLRFAKPTMSVSNGCLNDTIQDVEYVAVPDGLRNHDYIIITFGGYQVIATEPKQIELDRKFKLIEFHR